MKFVCMGYYDERRFAQMSEAEQAAMVAECTAYDQELHRNGHFADGVALQGAATATTVRWRDGKAIMTDGPFTETKEILGGILILEARDQDEALELIRRHPGIRIGPFEIRPVDEAFMSQHPILNKQQERAT